MFDSESRRPALGGFFRLPRAIPEEGENPHDGRSEANAVIGNRKDAEIVSASAILELNA